MCKRLFDAKFDFNAAFDEIDTNNNSNIDINELQNVMRKYDSNLSRDAGYLLFKRLE